MSEQTQAVVKAQSKTAVNSSPQGSALQHTAVNAERPLTEESNPPLNGHFEHDFSKVRINHHIPATVQTKLSIGQPGDQFEREADNIADTVMRMSAPGGSAMQTISPVSVGELRRQSDDDQQKNAAALSSTGSSQLIPDTGSSDRDKKLVSVLDTQPGAKPNNYDEAAGKVGEAFMKTDAGKQVVAWASETFLDKPGGKVITGAIAAEALAALYGTHSPLPIQPQIPLDFVKPGLSVKFTYEGPVNKPTKVGITVSFEPKKKEESLSTKNQKYRSETERMRAEQEKFREGLKTPQERKEDEEFQRRWLLQHDPLTKGLQQGSGGGAGTTSGLPGTPAPGSMQLQMPEYHPDLQNKGFNLPKLQLKNEEDKTLQRKESDTTPSATHTQGVPPIVHDVLHSSGQPLDSGTQAFMETRFNHDFSSVRVHTDGRAAESARSVNALAYTVGHDMVFGAGQYTPATMAGRRLLAHELTHVVQQRAMNLSVSPASLKIAPPQSAYEREAERVAHAPVSGHALSTILPTLQRQTSVPQPPSEDCSAKLPENCPTYEQWLQSFMALIHPSTGPAQTFSASDTAPGGKEKSSFTVLGDKPASHDADAAPEEQSPPPLQKQDADKFIDHPTDNWVRTNLPDELRTTAYQLPSDCADIAVILRHVWLFSHKRTETYHGWTVGVGAEKTKQARVSRIRNIIGSVYTGNVKGIANAYSDPRTPGKPLRSFAELQRLLHSGDILVWHHPSGGGHTQTIVDVVRDESAKITKLTVINGNQPIFPGDEPTPTHPGGQVEEIQTFEKKNKRSVTSTHELRNAPGRRIEVEELKNADLQDKPLPRPKDSKNKQEEMVWTLAEGTTLVVAGPAASAIRPVKGKQVGQTLGTLSDWLPTLRTATAENLRGIFEAALQATRAMIEGGQTISMADAHSLGLNAGKRLWTLAQSTHTTAERSHLQRLLEMRTVIQVLGRGDAQSSVPDRNTTQENLRKIFALIDEAFTVAARGGTILDINQKESPGKGI